MRFGSFDGLELQAVESRRWMCSWEVPPELLDQLDRHHEHKHPYVKRKREAAAIEAASLADKQQKVMPSEKELQKLRGAIV